MPVDLHVQHLEDQMKENETQLEIILAKSDKLADKLEAVTSTVAGMQQQLENFQKNLQAIILGQHRLLAQCVVPPRNDIFPPTPTVPNNFGPCGTVVSSRGRSSPEHTMT